MVMAPMLLRNLARQQIVELCVLFSDTDEPVSG